VLAEAFKDAYARTRRQVGLAGYYRLDRNQRDQLAVLLSQSCEVNVLRDVYPELEGDFVGMSALAADGSRGATGVSSRSVSAISGGGTDLMTDKTKAQLRAAVMKDLEVRFAMLHCNVHQWVIS
jgi:hypothetical protein